MSTRNYYLILGIPISESATGIRAAYRDLAKQHHPDRVGPKGKQAFQEISEAYATLSDPELRRAYDAEIDSDLSTEEIYEENIGSTFVEPEPLIPRTRARRRASPQHSPITIIDDAESIRPSLNALRERFVRNFTGLNVPKSERLEPLTVELILTPQEARYGIELPIRVPTFYICRVCRGTGQDWLFSCLACGAQGIVEDQQAISIKLPPMLHDGETFDVPLKEVAIRNLWLRLAIKVRDD